jgi:hypothetical protein
MEHNVEYIIYGFDSHDNRFVMVDEVENEAALRERLGEAATYTPVVCDNSGAIEIRHPFNPNRPMLAVPRAR